MNKHGLKACPFCGERYCISIREKIYNGKNKDMTGDLYHYVECLDCGSRTENAYDCDAYIFGMKSSKDHAKYLWNRRVQKDTAGEKIADYLLMHWQLFLYMRRLRRERKRGY